MNGNQVKDNFFFIETSSITLSDTAKSFSAPSDTSSCSKSISPPSDIDSEGGSKADNIFADMQKQEGNKECFASLSPTAKKEPGESPPTSLPNAVDVTREYQDLKRRAVDRFMAFTGSTGIVKKKKRKSAKKAPDSKNDDSDSLYSRNTEDGAEKTFLVSESMGNIEEPEKAATDSKEFQRHGESD
eukprot:TRINITY_DN12987_c0_g1_i4.p1 TRINITY_DN12987_c0_g1~~TRINITY_DN12987_c0_g1_i4.p1  ORF type:complete len:215 (-),score=31.57 TRINITY_DN12987_c0_g1_i4:60-617(-)